MSAPAPPSSMIDELMPVDAGLSEAMRELFARVFGHEMTAAHWAWKYGPGRGHGVGLLREGRMVAHYGGVPRRVSYFGRPVLACQVCDVMVERSANATLARRGPLYRVAARFLDQQVGYGRAHEVAFGFPSERHHAVARQLGLYGEVDRIVRLSWAADGDAGRLSGRLAIQAIGRAGVGLDARERRVVDRLWQRTAAELGDTIVGVRDADWVDDRYLGHPAARYELLLARRGWLGRPVGLVVLRRREATLELLDMVAPPTAYRALVAVARERALELGLARVEAWITQSQAWRFGFGGDAEPVVTDLGIPLPHITHTPGPSTDEQRGRWLLMAGDADFT